MNRPLAATLAAAALLWALVIVAAPRMLRETRFAGVTATVYGMASRICHQRTERSFLVAGVQMPVCARCTGLYVSGAAGAWLALIGWRELGASRRRALLAVAALPTAATWAAEVAAVMPFTNLSRALAALPLGLAGGWLFVGMLRYDAGLDASQDPHSDPRASRL